ncbi:zinc-dependent alcohol dehydrogenase family protein [Aspergillus fijiensis CBS 313.89]|uniref:Alcohol dehydrogenase superfamily protein n=1 Tax=Aspergillus fijiensis CBS 313.89 TaxID=1448319 RepID=A0A8G1W274_9EURO|nr:alcohol dehydrogenase superfamily protein [Aspergillus fijiensis CBS 313.89]RAK81720.1 alcohol dehydrogenase superfamily protein [Aspergillus fijiensis CBS 313.89]
MPSQRVIRINGPRNSVENLKEFQESVPEPTKYEVLVKVHGVSLNYRDIGVATSLYPFPVKDNVVPCSDTAGVVVKVGEGVKNVTVGDHVIGTFDITNLFGPQLNWENGQGGPIDGVLREYVCIPAASAVQVPKESALSFCEWSTLVCTGVTAWNALYGNIPLRPGQTVLFQGTGGVSITGLILAKAAGARTIITSSSDEKLKRVQADYGVDDVVNYKTHPEWSKEVLRLTQGQGVDYIFENGGSGTIGESLNAVKMGGNISVIGFLSQADQAKMPDVAALALSKGAVVRGITVGSTQLLQEVTRFVATRGLRLPVDKVFDFNEKAVVEAYKYAASGAQIGKVCIKVA